MKKIGTVIYPAPGKGKKPSKVYMKSRQDSASWSRGCLMFMAILLATNIAFLTAVTLVVVQHSDALEVLFRDMEQINTAVLLDRIEVPQELRQYQREVRRLASFLPGGERHAPEKHKVGRLVGGSGVQPCLVGMDSYCIQAEVSLQDMGL